MNLSKTQQQVVTDSAQWLEKYVQHFKEEITRINRLKNEPNMPEILNHLYEITKQDLKITGDLLIVINELLENNSE